MCTVDRGKVFWSVVLCVGKMSNHSPTQSKLVALSFPSEQRGSLVFVWGRSCLVRGSAQSLGLQEESALSDY